MPYRKIAIATLALGVLTLAGCSKTEDESPEARVFGIPPTIQTVSVDIQQATASCDFTDFFLGAKELCNDNATFLGGGVFVNATYSEVTLNVNVIDTDSTVDQSDILLVAASFLIGTAPNLIEETIVLFDDGSQNQFDFLQKNLKPTTCQQFDPDDECACSKTIYQVNSNDGVADDDIFSRGFAFASAENLPTENSGLLPDCIARANGQAAIPRSGISGSIREFRIEAVDRSGNLSEWPERPSVVLGPSTLECTGDACACCVLLTTSPNKPIDEGGCQGLPGVTFPPGSIFNREDNCPGGLCQQATDGSGKFTCLG